MAMTSVRPVARAAVFSGPNRRSRTTRTATPPGRAPAAMSASRAYGARARTSIAAPRLARPLAARRRAPRPGLTG